MPGLATGCWASTAQVEVAWFPSRLCSLTLAWVDLGNIVSKDKQAGLDASGQLSFGVAAS